jgi:hypothetical protein
VQNLTEKFLGVWNGKSDEFSDFLNFLLKSKARGVLDGWVASKFIFKIAESFLALTDGVSRYESLLIKVLVSWNLDESVKLLSLAQDKFYLVFIKRALESQTLKFSALPNATEIIGRVNQGVFKRLNENETKSEVENLDKTNQC